MIETRLVHHTIVPEKTALLVIDVTHDFVDVGAPMQIPMAQEILPRLQGVAQACRKAGGYVAYCGYTYQEQAMERMDDFWPPIQKGALAPETVGIQVVDEVRPEIGDLIIEKNTYSVFHGTPLEEELRNRGVDTVIVSGVAINYACYLTAREAQCRNFKVIFLSDGCCTFELPDMGLGAVSIEDVQKTFLTTIAYGCGHVMSSKEAIDKLEAGGG
ncbi:MAG: isochorismatase family protein [Actinobacteria bacterium]|nr:isochorismatase family protein [Actinomycetota bacterium]